MIDTHVYPLLSLYLIDIDIRFQTLFPSTFSTMALQPAMAAPKFKGTAVPNENILEAPLSGRRCLWYRVVAQDHVRVQRNNNHHRDDDDDSRRDDGACPFASLYETNITYSSRAR